jgi:hypothetical protein
MKYILLFYVLLIGLAVSGCGNLVTRTETDVFTITVKDTTDFYEQKNAPGNRDNGIVFPSSRTITSKRVLIQRDSVVERKYPDFIRLGVFESVGIVGGQSDSSLGTGLFGLFPDFSKLGTDYRGESAIFSGGIYRLFTGEWRLRWFGDAKNWSIGTSLWEVFVPDAHYERRFGSFLPLYVRKRWFLSDKIPYLCLTGAFGVGYYPSQYANLSLSLDLGSLGGFNMRAYGGFAVGYNGKGNYFVRNSPNTDVSQTVILPYLGLGVSFLDFHNTVDETYVEWKDQKHSAWNVGFLQLGILYTTADTSLGSDGSSTSLIKGAMFRLLNTSLALPFANNRFYAGVSLANLMVMGQDKWGLAVMPLRLGYWALLLEHELSTEPFVEVGFYPTMYFHVGNRLNLRFTDMLNIGLVMGYVNGSTSSAFGTTFNDLFGRPGDLSQFYVGISVGLLDRIFNKSELRY